MGEFDDMFGKTPEAESTSKSDKTRLSKEEYAEHKRAERERVSGMIDTTVQAVGQDGSMFRQYLNLQSRFNLYSVQNVLLVLGQKPDATKLKDFDGWKQSEHSVQKNAKAILINEPNGTYTAKDGTEKTAFRVKKVFDVSQTTTVKEAQHPEETLPDSTIDVRLIIKALMSNSPVEIRVGNELPDKVGAIFDPENNEIRIRPSMQGQDIIRALSLEMAHVELNTGIESDRNESAAKAYAVSYIICKRVGVNVDLYDFSKMPEYFSDLSGKEILGELACIRNAANEISSRMREVLEPQSKSVKQKENGAR